VRPALWAAGALVLGIWLAEFVRPHPLLVVGLLLLLLPAAAWLRRGALGALLLLAVAAGALRYAWVQTAGRGNLLAWVDQGAELVGTLVTEPVPQRGGGAAYTVAVEEVAGHQANGKLSVTQWSAQGATTPGAVIPRFGERVRLSGRLQRPLGPKVPGGFDQAAYLDRQGIDLTMKPEQVERLGPGNLSWFRRAAVATRLRLEEVLRQALPPRYAGLLAGLLFGTRTDLPPDVKAAFQESGVVHLLAVSGGNVAMILLPFIWALRWAGVRPRWAGAAGIPLVWFFVFLTGAGPSVVRAGLMATLVLLGDLLGRERNPLNTLGAAAAILLLIDPGLLYDIGFQLSVVATLGILLFARRIGDWLEPRLQAIWGERPGHWVAAGLSVTLAAQVVVEPVSLYHFGTLAPIAPLANLLVGLFLEPLVWVGTAVSLVGLLSPLIAWLLGWPVRAGLWLLIFLMKATAAVPGGYLEPGRLPLVGLVLWYGGLSVVAVPTLRAWMLGAVRSTWAWLTGRAPGGQPESLGQPWRRLALPIACLLLGWAALATFHPSTLPAIWPGRPSDELRLTALDVGQGDAILIEFPGGRTMLIDGGPAAPADPEALRPAFDAGTAVILPALRERGIQRLDWVVITHPHQDHAGGLPAVLRAMPVGMLLESGFPGTVSGYVESLRVAAEKEIPIIRLKEGERLALDVEVQARVLGPPQPYFHGTRSDENANSVVLLVEYRGVRMLLTGDLEAVGEERLLAQGVDLRADLLKVAHHGSRYSSTVEFLARVQPRHALVSMGRGNLFGHPDPGTIKRLQDAGATVYRTDQLGSITLATRGEGWTVQPTGRRRPEGAVGLFGRPLVGAW
jgi:competence protein ComEC